MFICIGKRIIMVNLRKKSTNIVLIISVILLLSGIIFWLINTFHIKNEHIFYPWFIVFSLFFMILQKLIAPLIIVVIFKSINQKSNYWSLLWITMFSTAANSSVPFPAGVPVRIFLQKKIIGIPYTSSTSELVIEMFLSYTCMVITCIITGILFLGPVFRQHLLLIKNSISYDFTTIGFIVLCIVLICFFIKKFKGKITEYMTQTLDQIFKTRLQILFIALCLIIISILISLLRLEMLLFAMGFHISKASLLPAMLLSYLAGVISFIPMGMGVRDISLSGLLVLLGIPLASAAVVAAVDRILLSIIYLIGSIIASYIFGKQMLNKNK